MTVPLTVELSAADRDQVSKLVEAVDRVLSRGTSQRSSKLVLSMQTEGDNEPRDVAVIEIVAGLRKLLDAIARNDAVLVEPLESRVSVPLAAELLRTSTKRAQALIDSRELRAHGIGQNQRVELRDVLKRAHLDEAERAEARRKLTALSEELGLYKD